MSDEQPNWVERRVNRSRILAEQSEDIWQTVRAAIQDACNSFQHHFGQPSVAEKALTCVPENSHRLLVSNTIQPDRIKNFHTTKRTILIEFDEDEFIVRATVDRRTPVSFSIVADDTHAFLIHHKEEITPDRLSQLVLEEFLFSKPERTTPTLHPRGGGEPNAWMGD